MRDGVNLIWRRLGDDYVVFNESSGQTYVPHPLSEWVLREIEVSEKTLGSLADQLVQDAELDPEVAEYRVREVLDEFNTMGLIEPGHKFD